MLQPELIEKIALFFYFSFLDETKANSATAHTIKSIRQQYVAQKKDDKKLTPAEFVAATENYMRKLSRGTKATSLAFSAGPIQLPPHSNWGPWFEFRKVASEKDFRALLYSKVLNISEEDIAEGLGLPIGTVRYRVGRGLKTLGRICHMGGVDAES